MVRVKKICKKSVKKEFPMLLSVFFFIYTLHNHYTANKRKDDDDDKCKENVVGI